MSRRQFASVHWTVVDVLGNIDQSETSIDANVARRILQAKETEIMDAMSEAGWRVIESAIDDHLTKTAID